MFHPTLSKSGRILYWPLIKACELMGKYSPKTLLQLRYYALFKKKLNLKDPKNINEKILWAKLYADTSEWTRLADKRLVRDYVKEIGLGDTLVELYATWYSADEVDFDTIPDDFIIKANNGDGKGTNKIVRKSELTPEKKEELKALVKDWLSRKNIGLLHAEPQYKGMRPCVIAEQLLPAPKGGSTLVDYKIWCFNGKAHYIWVCSDRSKDGNSAHVMTYDLDWNSHPEFSVFTSDYLRGEVKPRPKNLNKMIEIAERLSKGFPELRVDLYNIDGKIFFGELTFTSQGGLMGFYTEEFLDTLGSKFSISDFKRKS